MAVSAAFFLVARWQIASGTILGRFRWAMARSSCASLSGFANGAGNYEFGEGSESMGRDVSAEGFDPC